MYCESCGQKNNEDSKFCRHCGSKIDSGSSTKEEKSSTKIKKTAKSITLWDKFAEIYDSRNEERKEFTDQSSNEAWELINRLSTNTFENYIQLHKEALNTQPYKALEVIKSAFSLSTSGGYFMWMAEYLLKNSKLTKLQSINLDEFIKEWDKVAVEDYSLSFQKIPEETSNSLNTFFNFQFNNILENAPSLKELELEIIEALKTQLILLIVGGYHIGVCESKHRN
jgi:hypothetical protein